MFLPLATPPTWCVQDCLGWTIPAVFNGEPAETITLTNGQLTLERSLLIDGSAIPDGIIVSGNSASRVFEVASNATVLATSDLGLPLNLWSNLGFALEMPPGFGQFQFTDLQATNHPQRYYRVRSP